MSNYKYGIWATCNVVNKRGEVIKKEKIVSEITGMTKFWSELSESEKKELLIIAMGELEGSAKFIGATKESIEINLVGTYLEIKDDEGFIVDNEMLEEIEVKYIAGEVEL